MKNILRFLTAVFLIFLLMGSSIWVQTTINVPGDYSTIEAAVNAASNGDIINVAAGIYTPAGGRLIINKSITLQADPSSTTRPKINTNCRSWTSCAIQIASDNVIFQGFEVDNSAADPSHLKFYIVGDYGNAKNGWTIRNCDIHNGRNCIRPVGNNVTIEYNNLHETESDLINAEYGNCYGLKVRYNWLHSHHSDLGGKPAGITYTCSSAPGADVEISYNYCWASRTFIDFQNSGGLSPANKIIVAHNTVDYWIGDLPVPIVGTENAQQMSIAWWSSTGKWNGPNFEIRDNIFSRQKWYEVVDTDNLLQGEITLKNNMFWKWYLNDTWYPSYQYLNEWPDLRGAVGWDNMGAGNDFVIDMGIIADPFYAATGSTPDEYYALTCASPAYNTATDGTHIGAWQGILLCTVPITSTAGTNGTITPLGVTNVDYGGDQNYTITPDLGYHIVDVLVDGNSQGAIDNYTFNNVTVSHTISVSFAGLESSISDIITELLSLFNVSLTNTNSLNKTGENKDDKKLEEVIKYLTNALEPDLWLDEIHLDAKHGNKVFDEIKKAVNKLNELVKDKKSSLPDETLHGIIINLANITDLLARVEINDAAVSCLDNDCQKEIDKANDEMEKAQEELVKENYDKAIDHNKKAWEHAEKAIKKTLDKSSPDKNIVASFYNLPVNFSLYQNYPNPFNPTTSIKFDLPEAANVSLKVYNSLGQLVATLISNEYCDAGRYEKTFEANKLASGVYIYQLICDKFTAIKKMVITK